MSTSNTLESIGGGGVTGESSIYSIACLRSLGYGGRGGGTSTGGGAPSGVHPGHPAVCRENRALTAAPLRQSGATERL